MKTFSKTLIVTVLGALVVLGLSEITMAATTPDLGEAASFAILSSTYTNTAAGTINGNLGYTTPPATPTTVNGMVYTPKPPQAGIDQNAALVKLNEQSCDFNFNTATDLSLLPQPLTPGVYCVTAATSIGTNGITLNGNGTYIFRISGAFNTVANSIVSLAGGANACDIFWTPNSATTLGADSTLIWTIIDNAGITIGNNVILIGRALNFATTVTTNNDNITVPTCSTPTDTSTTNPTTNPTQSINIVKTVNRSTPFPYGWWDVIYTYVVTNPGNTPISNIVVADNKCMPLIFIDGDINHNNLLDDNETWTYTCLDTISVSTTNIAIVAGKSNGITVSDSDSANIMVAESILPDAPVTPNLPNTGLVDVKWYNNSLYITIIASILLLSWIISTIALVKRNA